MNIYEKLQNMRVELQQMNIKKSGKNKFAGYEYYELADILPPINSVQQKYKTCSFIAYNKDDAILTLVNAEKPDEVIVFTSPMAEASLKGTHPIQNLGAVETYQRRYLYMTAFEIVENDFLDATQGAQPTQQKPPRPQSKPKSNLSKDNADKLNAAIMQLKDASGSSMPEIKRQIEAYAKKPLSAVNDSDVDFIVDFLNTLSEGLI